MFLSISALDYNPSIMLYVFLMSYVHSCLLITYVFVWPLTSENWDYYTSK